jgi:hypothetical protein
MANDTYASIKYTTASGQPHTLKAFADGINPAAAALASLNLLVAKAKLMLVTKVAGSGSYSWQETDTAGQGFEIYVSDDLPAEDLLLKLVRVVGGRVVDRATVKIVNANAIYKIPDGSGFADLTAQALIDIASAYYDDNGNTGFTLSAGYYVD